jgi:uncharacterized YccA/Bax inhibitor family protein
MSFRTGSRMNRFTRSSNPVFQDSLFDKAGRVSTGEDSMTVDGAINKSFILFVILLLGAGIGWNNPIPLVIWGGAIAGLILVIITVFRMRWAPYTAPMYAFLEGLFVGGISVMYASLANGLIFKAMVLTFAILFTMLFVYKSGLIKVTGRFRRGVIIATGGVLLLYLMSFILSLFGVQVAYLHEGGWIGIGLSLLIIGIASLNLLLDFDNFEKGARAAAPRYFEWFCAMGLLITLVWLYVEILRLLAMLNSND